MNLDRYIADLRAQLAASAQTGGGEARALAERLSASLDAAARLVLLEALSDAAGEITLDLAPGGVDVRLRGRDAEFVVTRPPAEFDDVAPLAPSPSPPLESADIGDETTASRTTVRIPDQLKARAERAAAAAGQSLNAWLVRAIASALEPSAPKPPGGPSGPHGGRGASFTGWVR